MAGHLVKKVATSHVFHRTAAKAKAWTENSAARPRDAEGRREGQDFVMACVGNDNDLRRLRLAPTVHSRHEERRDLRRSHHRIPRSARA